MFRRAIVVVVGVVGVALVGCAPIEDEEDGAGAPFEIGDEPGADGKADSAMSGRWAGSPLELDRGPTESWAATFAEVPNYRAVSRALGATWLVPGPDGKTKLQTVNEARAAAAPPLPPIPEYTLTKDKFRYEMGPIFYRGRLDGTARVLVVGQDAATDEALVQRAFTGGTGQKVQNWLNAVGITSSYVCLNTFIYSIYEQYDEFTRELATTGAIKDYRNRLFEKVFAENEIELVVSFGAAAHESVRIFRDERLGGRLPPNVVWVQMLHPGGAGVVDPNAPPPANPDEPAGPNQEALAKIAESFAKGWKRVWDTRAKRRGWLPPDRDGRKVPGAKFYYASNDVPFRDLPFGVSREIGRGGTKSERAESGLQVQLRSANGARYMAPSVPYPTTADRAHSGLTLGPGEVSWEPAKVAPADFDRGPERAWVELFAATPPLAAVEAEVGVSVASDFADPVWTRGRLDGSARTLVIALDGGVDRFVAGRALVGELGQKLQHFVANTGLDAGRVTFLSLFPYTLANVAPEQHAVLAAAPSLAAHRAKILERLLGTGAYTTVITVGEVAHQAFAQFEERFVGTRVRLRAPGEADVVGGWNEALAQVRAANPSSTAPFKRYSNVTFAGLRRMIPRADLSWGVPMWLGTSGDLSVQPHESWLFWNAPRWVNREPPAPADAAGTP
jgi:uracil-DNA glycosylase